MRTPASRCGRCRWADRTRNTSSLGRAVVSRVCGLLCDSRSDRWQRPLLELPAAAVEAAVVGGRLSASCIAVAVCRFSTLRLWNSSPRRAICGRMNGVARARGRRITAAMLHATVSGSCLRQTEQIEPAERGRYSGARTGHRLTVACQVVASMMASHTSMPPFVELQYSATRSPCRPALAGAGMTTSTIFSLSGSMPPAGCHCGERSGCCPAAGPRRW